MRIERLARAHSILGWLTFLAFLASGVHMLQPNYHGGSDLVRALHRANHLYLLGAALLHLLAARIGAAPGKLRGRLRVLGSLVLFAVSPVLVLAFLREPSQGLADRPLTIVGEALALVGCFLIALTTPKAQADA